MPKRSLLSVSALSALAFVLANPPVVANPSPAIVAPVNARPETRVAAVGLSLKRISHSNRRFNAVVPSTVGDSTLIRAQKLDAELGPPTAAPKGPSPTSAGPSSAGPNSAGPNSAGPNSAGPNSAKPSSAGSSPSSTGASSAGPLDGWTIAVKANIDLVERPADAASGERPGGANAGDAFAIDLVRSAGGLVVAVTTMDTWARGISTTSTRFGSTGNAHDSTRSPFGSSGGSAVAVATVLGIVGVVMLKSKRR